MAAEARTHTTQRAGSGGSHDCCYNDDSLGPERHRAPGIRLVAEGTAGSSGSQGRGFRIDAHPAPLLRLTCQVRSRGEGAVVVRDSPVGVVGVGQANARLIAWFRLMAPAFPCPMP